MSQPDHPGAPDRTTPPPALPNARHHHSITEEKLPPLPLSPQGAVLVAPGGELLAVGAQDSPTTPSRPLLSEASRPSSAGGKVNLTASPSSFGLSKGAVRLDLPSRASSQSQLLPQNSTTKSGRLATSHSFFDDNMNGKDGNNKQQPGKQLSRVKSIKKIKGVDAYATRVTESTMAGAVITLLVWGATIAYLVVMIMQWLSEPPTKVVGTEWTIGFGPTPMNMTCLARSGCLISNVASSANTLGVSALITPSQTVCTRLEFNQSTTIDVIYSVDPVDGLSVMFDASTANATSLVGGGLVIISQIRCPTGEPDCVMLLPSPIAGGTALLQYVETHNDTAEGQAKHRREWFGNMISTDGSVMRGSTPCYDPSNPDPKLAGWVQARLRMNSFYNTVNVSKDSLWLFLFGAAGGAYALFLQAGAIMLLAGGALSAVRGRVTGQGAVHDEEQASTSMREGREGRDSKEGREDRQRV